LSDVVFVGPFINSYLV